MREEKIRFESFELTPNGTVRPSAVLRRLQQAARDDLNSFGISYQDLRDQNMAFVVSRMALEFFHPLEGEKELLLRTGPNPTRGATFPRSFVIEDQTGVLCRAMSLWALIDFEKKLLLRPSALPKEIPAVEDLSGGLSCLRLAKVQGEMPNAFESRKVYASMLDQNDHLNNCNYADLACDLLPEDCDEVKTIHLSFQKEARRNDVLLLDRFDRDGSYQIQASFADSTETCFLCQIETF